MRAPVPTHQVPANRCWEPTVKDVALGTPYLREIDNGLAQSRVGVVLVTPALLSRLKGEGIADK